MNNREDPDGISSSTHFIPTRRPPYNRSQNSAVQIRQNCNRAPRPHSIGASIISNPKLVKGWQYYDNSPNQKDVRKYLSTINIPCEQIDNNSNHGGDSSNHPSYRHNNSPNRDSYKRGVGVIGANDFEDNDDFVPGVEVQACVAPDSDFDEDDDGTVEEKVSWCGQFLGIILTIIASSALSLSAVLLKSLPKDKYHPYSISVWTFQGIILPSLVIFILSLCMCRVKKRKKDTIYFDISRITRSSSPLKRKCWTGGLVILRALFGWLGVVLYVYSLRYMSVADSTIITFSAPVFVGIAAWCYLKEKMGLVPILTAVIVLFGVGVITRPPLLTGKQEFDTDQLIGSGMAVGSMLLGVFSVIILRYIRKVHYALVTFVYGLLATVGSLLLCFTRLGEGGFQFPEGATDWGKAGAIAGLTFIGQNLMTVALKYEQAGIFAVVRTWEIPVTFLWQYLLLKEVPDYLSIIGAALVSLGVVIITVRKWIQTLPETSKIRRFCCCILI